MHFSEDSYKNSPDVQEQLRILQSQLLQQQQELEFLRAEIGKLYADDSTISRSLPHTKGTMPNDERQSRRALLKWGSAAAALTIATVATATENLHSSTAHAADQGDLVLGDNNYADRTTYLKPTNAGHAPNTLLEVSGGQISLVGRGGDTGVQGVGASVGVNGNGSNIGVYGTSPNEDSTGVKGSSKGSGYGVFGHAGVKGIGVHGEADDRGVGVHGVILDGNGIAVKGEIPGSGAALAGYAGNGVGVNAESAGTGTSARLATNSDLAVHLQLVPSTSESHPSDAPDGTLYVDKNNRLWFFSGAHWTQLA